MLTGQINFTDGRSTAYGRRRKNSRPPAQQAASGYLQERPPGKVAEIEKEVEPVCMGAVQNRDCRDSRPGQVPSLTGQHNMLA